MGALPHIPGAKYRRNPKVLIPVAILIIAIFYFTYIVAIKTAADETNKEVSCEDRNFFVKLFTICGEDLPPPHSE